MSGSGKPTISFKYDDNGIRTKKTHNGLETTYSLDVDGNVIYETNSNDAMHYTYDETDSPVSMNLNGTDYYYVKNLQGDIISIINASGTAVVNYLYDSWGKLISTTGSLASTVGVKNPYRYRGYRYDTETGLYYLQSRYYNPEWGRFVSADDPRILQATKGQILGANLFTYCLNNPINMLDENGYKSVWNTFCKLIKGGALDIVKFFTGLFGIAKSATTLINDITSHAINVINIGNNNTRYIIPIKGLTENRNAYIKRCKNSYFTLTLFVKESVIKNKYWSNISNKHKKEIIGTMGSWDKNAYLLLFYRAHASMLAEGYTAVY